jgi:hypothetical protein
MGQTGEEASLNAAALVSRHRASTKLYAVKQVAELMIHHKLTVDDIKEHLNQPSRLEKMRELKAKLFSPEPVRAEVVEDGVSVRDENADAGETASEEAGTLKALVPKTHRQRRKAE